MVRKFKPPLRTNIGRGRIPYTDTSSRAHFERQVREQLKAVIGNYKAWAAHIHEVSADVLKEALEPTFEKSQVYVPKDTRALARSGYLETRTFRGKAVVEIGYARGGKPHYAALVHEDLEAFHEEPTQAKYLERALLEDEGDIQKRIQDAYKDTSDA